MASLNLNGKRRRVEHAASGLSKPFKSPLRRPPQTPDKETTAMKRETDGSLMLLSSKPSHLQTPIAQEQSPLPPPSLTRATSHPPSVNRKRSAPTSRLTTPRKQTLSDPVILDLQKQQRTLQSRIASVRSELDTAQQALRIESSNKEAILEALIAKWRSISQSAAEEVFTGAQERVSRMGGMKGWKERMRNDATQWEREEMEAWYGDPAAEGLSEDADELEARKAEMLDRLDIEEPQKAKLQGQNEVENEVRWAFPLLLRGVIYLLIDLELTGTYYGYHVEDAEC